MSNSTAEMGKGAALLKKPGNGKKGKLALGLAAVLAAGGIIYQISAALKAESISEPETVYKESKVSRGDITVGVSESGTTSLETLMHTFSVNTTVDEVLVKAGQYVEKGDILIKLDSSDIQEELTELQNSYRTANVKYQEQLLQQTLTKTNAESVRRESLAKTDAAGLEYDLSIDDKNLTVLSAEDSVKTIQEQIKYYQDLLDAEDEDDLREKYGLDDILDEIDSLESDISYVNSQIRALQNTSSSGCSGCSNSLYVPHDNVTVTELEDGKGDAEYSYRQYKASFQEAAGSIDGFTVQQLTAALEAGIQPDGLSDSQWEDIQAVYQKWQDNYELYQQYVDTIAHVSAKDNGSVQLGNLETQLSSLESQLKQAEQNWDTQSEKFEQEYDDAENQIESLESQLKSAEIKYQQALLNQQLNSITAENDRINSLSGAENAEITYQLALLQAESSVLSAEDELTTLQNKISEMQDALNDCEVKARCSGLVMSVMVNEGDEITDNTTLAIVSNSEKAYITVSISQDDIADVSIGKECNILFAAYPEEKYTGVVDSISTSPARSGASTVSYSVSVLVDGDCTKLYEGMTADVTFITKEIQDVLYVSNRTITSEDGKQYVKVKREDGTIERVEVATGFSDGTNAEITGGLSEGDIVLIESTIRRSA